MWQPLLKASDSSTFWHEHMYFILVLICTSDAAEHTELRYCFSIHHLFSPAFGNSALHSLHCYNDIDESQGTETHEIVLSRHKNQDICVICVQKHNCTHTRAILASKLAQSYSLKQWWKQEPKGTKLLEHAHTSTCYAGNFPSGSDSCFYEVWRGLLPSKIQPSHMAQIKITQTVHKLINWVLNHLSSSPVSCLEFSILFFFLDILY